MTEPNPSTSPDGSASPVPTLIPVAIAWSAVVAVGGGFASGLLMSFLSKKTQFGILGGLILWGLGAVAGIVSRKITRTACPVAAWALVAACVVAFGIAEISWYHWTYDIRDSGTGDFRPQTWSESFAIAPAALWNRAPITLALGVACTVFGAIDAYRRAGKRYRFVAIAEDS
jgi:hypothetical protein